MRTKKRAFKLASKPPKPKPGVENIKSLNSGYISKKAPTENYEIRNGKY